MKIAGATALVTGANRGLGLAFTRALLERGAAKVYAGARDPGLDEPGDAVGEHARLARAGARQHQQRALAVRDGGALGLVQAREQVLDSLVCGDVRHPRRG